MSLPHDHEADADKLKRASGLSSACSIGSIDDAGLHTLSPGRGGRAACMPSPFRDGDDENDDVRLTHATLPLLVLRRNWPFVVRHSGLARIVKIVQPRFDFAPSGGRHPTRARNSRRALTGLRPKRRERHVPRRRGWPAKMTATSLPMGSRLEPSAGRLPHQASPPVCDSRRVGISTPTAS
jgi:hypothetical protein